MPWHEQVFWFIFALIAIFWYIIAARDSGLAGVIWVSVLLCVIMLIAQGLGFV